MTHGEIYFSPLVASPLVGKNPGSISPQFGIGTFPNRAINSDPEIITGSLAINKPLRKIFKYKRSVIGQPIML